MSQAATAVVHSRASIDVRAMVLPRAQWETEYSSDGRLAFKPQKGTWYGHVVRGKSAHDITVIAMVSCPSCGGLLCLAHSADAAKHLSRMLGKPIPVAHSIDHLGRVSPDAMCGYGRCDFHRRIYLDRWNKTKPLFAIAYVNLSRGEHGKIEIAYSHSIDAREARLHLGAGNFRIIASGLALGFFVDETTGRVTAD
jgi:hypothetical protein